MSDETPTVNLWNLLDQAQAEQRELTRRLDDALMEGKKWAGRAGKAEGEVDAAVARAEQLQVQLAGCLVAAEGGTKDTAKQGDYGWSLAYQRTLDLYARAEKAEKERESWRRIAVEHGAIGEVAEANTAANAGYWRDRAEKAEMRPCVELCMEEREMGNGGCGACALCCREANERTQNMEARALRAEEALVVERERADEHVADCQRAEAAVERRGALLAEAIRILKCFHSRVDVDYELEGFLAKVDAELSPAPESQHERQCPACGGELQYNFEMDESHAGCKDKTCVHGKQWTKMVGSTIYWETPTPEPPALFSGQAECLRCGRKEPISRMQTAGAGPLCSECREVVEHAPSPVGWGDHLGHSNPRVSEDGERIEPPADPRDQRIAELEEALRRAQSSLAYIKTVTGHAHEDATVNADAIDALLAGKEEG